jgi:hypothetical protein
MSKILHVNWSVDFDMDGEREKSRMKRSNNKLVSLVSSLNLGSENFLIEECVQLAREKKLLMHSTTWPSWMIWHGVERFIWV